MREINKIVHVPATEYTKKVYVADDGTEFDTKKGCEFYETNYKTKQHPAIKTRIEGLNTWDDEYQATLYYISCDEDYEFIRNKWLYSSHTISDYYTYGPGWYLFYSIDGGDGPDFHYWHNLEQYMKDATDALKIWKKKIRDVIKNSNIEKEKSGVEDK